MSMNRTTPRCMILPALTLPLPGATATIHRAEGSSMAQCVLAWSGNQPVRTLVNAEREPAIPLRALFLAVPRSRAEFALDGRTR